MASKCRWCGHDATEHATCRFIKRDHEEKWEQAMSAKKGE